MSKASEKGINMEILDLKNDLDNNEINNIIKEGRSISANYMNGPTFGFYDLYFYPDMKNGKSFSRTR